MINLPLSSERQVPRRESHGTVEKRVEEGEG
jgi:hypothetical protein